VNACFVEGTQKAKLNVIVSATTDLILLIAMILGVMRIKSDSSIWRLLYVHVCLLYAIAGYDPEHIIYAGYGLDRTSHSRTDSADGASPPSPITVNPYSSKYT
jgi:hypothetical protein